MIKICYITTIAETMNFLEEQMTFLGKNGYEMCAICSFNEGCEEKIGENTRFIPVEIARGIAPQTLIKSILKLKKAFKEEAFDLVQYSTPNAAFCASIAARLARVKIRNYHCMGFRYVGAKGFLRFVLKMLEKIICMNSTHIECVSKSNLEFGIKEKLFPPEKAVVVWNGSTGGVDLERFDIRKKQVWRDEVRQDLGFDNNDFVFGFIGRVTKDKGVNELFEAFTPISDNCKLLVLGHEEGIETLDKALYSDAKNNENIIFHGVVQDVERYFAAIDVLVLPSYREGFGNVIIEAGAMGIPAIVSNIPGPIDAVIPGETAIVVDVKNAPALANAMATLLNNKALVTQLSDNAYKHVCNSFDSKKLNEKILERKRMLLGE